MIFKKFIIYFLITSIIYSCAHTKLINNSQNKSSFTPKIGDAVEIITKDGKQYKIFIKEISADSVKSDKYSISKSDIKSIRKIESNPLGAILIFSGIIAIGYLILLVNSISHISADQ